MNIAIKCIDDSTHFFRCKSHMTDGLSCPICKGRVSASVVFGNEYYHKLPFYEDLHKKSVTNEIEIIMTSANKPPKIKLNGEDIDGIVSLDYKYETKDLESNGIHNFTVQYIDKETSTIRTISANKIAEG